MPFDIALESFDVTPHHFTDTCKWELYCPQCTGAPPRLGSGFLSCPGRFGPCNICHRSLKDITTAAGNSTLCADCSHCPECQTKFPDFKKVGISPGFFCFECRIWLPHRRSTKKTKAARELHQNLETNFNEIVPRFSRNSSISPILD